MIRVLRTLYGGLVSPVLHWFAGPGYGCRFEPTCSLYAREAIEMHGSWRGAWLAGGRILRCHPFCSGGHDPVPSSNLLRGRVIGPSTALGKQQVTA